MSESCEETPETRAASDSSRQTFRDEDMILYFTDGDEGGAGPPMQNPQSASSATSQTSHTIGPTRSSLGGVTNHPETIPLQPLMFDPSALGGSMSSEGISRSELVDPVPVMEPKFMATRQSCEQQSIDSGPEFQASSSRLADALDLQYCAGPDRLPQSVDQLALEQDLNKTSFLGHHVTWLAEAGPSSTNSGDHHRSAGESAGIMSAAWSRAKDILASSGSQAQGILETSGSLVSRTVSLPGQAIESQAFGAPRLTQGLMAGVRITSNVIDNLVDLGVGEVRSSQRHSNSGDLILSSNLVDLKIRKRIVSKRNHIGISLLAEAVEAFVHCTGGGKGLWFAEGAYFGLGISRSEGFDACVNVPTNFGHGRRLPQPPMAAVNLSFDEFVAGKAADIAFGRISWNPMVEPACYIRVPTNLRHGAHVQELLNPQAVDSSLPHMLRFFTENVWDLELPRLLISVTGTTEDFDISLQHKSMLLLSLIKQASETHAWIVTNGVDSGISRLLGEARQSAQSNIPLIGVLPWGVVSGRQALWEHKPEARLASHCDKIPVQNFAVHEERFEFMKPPAMLSFKLNRYHSHFIFVDDATTGQARGEAPLRAAWESCLCDLDEKMQEQIRKILFSRKIGWQDIHIQSDSSNSRSSIPRICFCIQGGPLSIDRIYECVRNNTPVLLARHTGGTADLLSDSIDYLSEAAKRSQEDQCLEDSHLANDESDEDEMKSDSAHSLANASQLHSDLMSAVFATDDDHEGASVIAAELKQVYGKDFSRTEQLLCKIQLITRSGLISYFDVRNPKVDVSESMLKGILKREFLLGKGWKDTLHLVVMWGHVPTLKKALTKLDMVNGSHRRAVEKAFHLAVKQDKHTLVSAILEHWDCTHIYDFRTKNTCSGDTSVLIRTVSLAMQKRRNLVKTPLSNWEMISTKLLLNTATVANVAAVTLFSQLREVALQDRKVAHLYERVEHAGMGQRSQLEADPVFRRPEFGVGQLNDRMPILEKVFTFVIGVEWWYDQREIEPNFDLFLWSVLLLRVEMAKVFWERLDFPVRSALLASTFYRRWADSSSLGPHTRNKMLEHAGTFEQMAVDVQQIAHKMSDKKARQSLEQSGDVVQQHTAVDLAIIGNNHVFIERCCGEALQYRWSGDLNPYRQRFGLPLSVLTTCLSFGFAAPALLQFRSPPSAESLRPPSLRVKITKTSINSQRRSHSNRRRAPEAQRILAAGFRWSQDASTVQLQHVWHGQRNATFWLSDGLQKCILFVRAPVTIFELDALMQLVLNLVFTRLLFRVQKDGLSGMYWDFVCLSVFSTTICEVVGIFLRGWQHLQTFWSVAKVLHCILFWLGYMALVCLHSDDESCALRASYFYFSFCRPRANSVSNLLAGSLFLMWVRVLYLMTVSSTLGPLVKTLERIMRKDLVMFSALWGAMLIAFATATQSTREMDSSPEGCESTLRIQCWENWWLIRTYYSAMGQSFLEDLKTDSEHIISLFLVPFMNVVLVNLLIAMMNDTFNQVKDQSRLRWMEQMYFIIQDYKSPSNLSLLCLLYDFVTFSWRINEVRLRVGLSHRQRNTLEMAGMPGILASFKQYQDGTLPCMKPDQVEKEFEAMLEVLAKAIQASREAEMPELEEVNRLRRLVRHQMRRVRQLNRLLGKEKLLGIRSQIRAASLFFSAMQGSIFSRGQRADDSFAIDWMNKLKRKLVRIQNRIKWDADALRDNAAFLASARDTYVAEQKISSSALHEQSSRQD